MTTAMDMTPAGVLRGAADWLAEDPARWGRDYFVAPVTKCRCASGAIAQVLDPSDLNGDPTSLRDREKTDLGRWATALLHDYLIDFKGAPVGFSAISTIGDWNDDPSRTAAEVIDALRGTAAERDARLAARMARAS